MRTTIKDIANDTGFSVTTISLVLNGKAHKIPESTKKQILESAKKLDYRPNQLAVSLVKKRSKTIGLIIPDIGNVFFANMAKGIEEACRHYGRTVILCNTNDMHERDIEYIHLLADKGVDGIIYVMSKDSDEEIGKVSIELLKRMQIPFVLLDRFIENEEYPSVVLDHEAGGYLAAKHLLELGHRKIACVTGPIHMTASRRRYQGFLNAFNEMGAKPDENLMFEGDYTMECGIDAIKHLIHFEFTALFACNDLSAFGVYKQLREYEKTVPRDISVVGYDDVVYAELMAVPLTTVRQPVYSMGVESVKKLIQQIRKTKMEKKSTVFEPELIIRNSTARRG